MSRAVITIVDQDGDFKIGVDFDPPLLNEELNDRANNPHTHKAAMFMVEALAERMGGVKDVIADGVRVEQ